jgi:hypothetical protein
MVYKVRLKESQILNLFDVDDRSMLDENLHYPSFRMIPLLINLYKIQRILVVESIVPYLLA